MQKYRKKDLEIIAATLLKAVFKFLNTMTIKILTLECNFVVACIFKQWICLPFFLISAFNLVVFFYTRATFSFNGHLSLFSVQSLFCSKVMIEYNISAIQFSRISSTHCYTMFLLAIL